MKAGMKRLARRWLKFNLVGALGILVQLAALHLSVSVGVNYLAATLLAVETAILHNFCWHQAWTWRDRRGHTLVRLMRFNAGAGIVSITGNLLTMALLVGGLQLPLIVANLMAIGVCALVNFFVAELFVFTTETRA